MAALDVQLVVARADEYPASNQLYLQWGYRGGIAASDVVYCASVDRQVVGLVRQTTASGVLMLRGMHVAPEHQRQGIDARLLGAFVADLPRLDCA
jgi:GNAT superfamily N-acetyltransferase